MVCWFHSRSFTNKSMAGESCSVHGGQEVEQRNREKRTQVHTCPTPKVCFTNPLATPTPIKWVINLNHHINLTNSLRKGSIIIKSNLMNGNVKILCASLSFSYIGSRFEYLFQKCLGFGLLCKYQPP